jgi:hypothetical protein
MAPLSGRIALVCGIAIAVSSAITAAQQQVYRYVDKDGRVIYTDRAPPPDGKEVQAKRLSPNFIENNDVPIATVQAAQRFPVTLYTFACGAVCQSRRDAAQSPRRPVHDGQRGRPERRRAADESHRWPAGARSSGRRQVDRQGLQRSALDDDARRCRVSEDAAYATRDGQSGRARGACRSARADPVARGDQALPVPGSGYPKQ